MSKKSFNEITVTSYSEKAVVVRGNTKDYIEDLKQLGGKYNGRLRDGPGWIFSKKMEKDIKTFISNGAHIADQKEIKPKQWDYSSENKVMLKMTPTLSEYGMMLGKINDMSEKINFMEKAMALLLNKSQLESLDRVVVKKPKPKKPVEKQQETIVLEDSSSEEEERPRIRLLR